MLKNFKSSFKDNDHLIVDVFSVVIETLKTVDSSQKCFRMVGGILSERTVKEVLPALENNKVQVSLLYLLIFVISFIYLNQYWF